MHMFTWLLDDGGVPANYRRAIAAGGEGGRAARARPSSAPLCPYGLSAPRHGRPWHLLSTPTKN